jgi:phage repressor protein C with HTH and peptisase S24 domain
MSPTINEGDLVFVDTAFQRFETNGIYVIIWNNRLLIKRLEINLTKNCVDVRSDNEKYDAQAIHANEVDHFHICGLVKT